KDPNSGWAHYYETGIYAPPVPPGPVITTPPPRPTAPPTATTTTTTRAPATTPTATTTTTTRAPATSTPPSSSQGKVAFGFKVQLDGGNWVQYLGSWGVRLSPPNDLCTGMMQVANKASRLHPNRVLFCRPHPTKPGELNVGDFTELFFETENLGEEVLLCPGKLALTLERAFNSPPGGNISISKVVFTSRTVEVPEE
ncbi:hypothetical protein CSKR_200824, partial [Clonorchis sinensis]